MPTANSNTKKLEAVEAEVSAEGTEYVTVELCGEPIRVLPPTKWRTSANDALLSGNVEGWARGCLYGDDYEDVWRQVDPTLEDADEFFAAWAEKSGQSAGKSSPSRGSSRSTRRR
jgi:hypothetical protein